MADDRSRQKADMKRPVHVKWDGKTIALGTFPPEEAEEKCARAKALTKKWRTTMRPKPSADWVKSALERLNIRVVYDRPGRPFLGASQGNRSGDRERQKKAQHKQQQSFSSPSAPPLGDSLRDDGMRSSVGAGRGIPRDPYGRERAGSTSSAAAAHAYGTNPGRGSTMQQPDISQAAGYFGAAVPGANMRRTIDERNPSAPIPNPTAGDIIEGRYPYSASSYLYPKNDPMTSAIRGNDSSKIKSPGRMENTTDRYPDAEDAQSYDSRHYDMLKNHHMNLLRELEETTVLMNAIRRKQEHRQQQQQQQPQQQQQEPQPQPPYPQAQSTMANPSPYASASYPREIQSQLANLSNLHPQLPQRPSIGSSPMRIPPSYSNLPTDSLLAALGPRQQLPPYPPAGQRFDEGLEAAILNRQRMNDRLGTDHLSRPLDRSNYNDLMNSGGRLGQAGSSLLQNVIERRLSNPIERQGRLDYLSPMHATRDRQDPNFRHYNTAGVDPMAQQDTGLSAAAASGAVAEQQHDFSDSLFATNIDSSASGSRRQSDASRSSYQPFPQQDQDQRLQPGATRPSSIPERQSLQHHHQHQHQQRDEESLLCKEEVKAAVDEKAEHERNINTSQFSAAAMSQAASEDIKAATSLKNFQRQSSGEHLAGAKRDSSWLQKSDETKEFTTTTTEQSSEPSRKRHNLEISTPPHVPQGTGSRPSSKQASSSNKQEGDVPEGGKVAEC